MGDARLSSMNTQQLIVVVKSKRRSGAWDCDSQKHQPALPRLESEPRL